MQALTRSETKLRAESDVRIAQDRANEAKSGFESFEKKIKKGEKYTEQQAWEWLLLGAGIYQADVALRASRYKLHQVESAQKRF